MKSKRTLTNKQLIEVYWEDATSVEGWNESVAGLGDGLLPCRTVGYFIRYTKKSIQLAPTYSTLTLAAADIWSIPRKCVTKVRKVK